MDLIFILDLAGALAFGSVIGWIAGSALSREQRSGWSYVAAVLGTLLGGGSVEWLTDARAGLLLYGMAFCISAGFAWLTRPTSSVMTPADWLGGSVQASIEERGAGIPFPDLRTILGTTATLSTSELFKTLGQLVRRPGAVLQPGTTSKAAIEPDPPHPVRVLNANFADLKGNALRRDELMLHGTAYDLQVDIGPEWQDGLSIVSGPKIFPDDQLPKDSNGHIIQVVFVSDAYGFVFADEDDVSGERRTLSTALWLPSRGGPSHPLLPDGTPQSNPGPVTLRVRTPELFATPGQRSIWSKLHGRLCLYYENNLLQSAAVHVTVGHPWEVGKVAGDSSIKVDFVLTRFREIETLRRRQIAKLGQEETEPGEPIKLNMTLNDDGSGSHRILISGLGEPAVVQYDPLGSEQLLADARQFISECYWQRAQDGSFVLDANNERKLGLAPDNGKSLDAFKWDLLALAGYGSKLFGLIFTNVIPPKGKTRAQWIRQLRSTLTQASTIQISRTGPAQYIFPWGLVYDYDLISEKNYKICPVVDEEWGSGARRPDRPIATRCPHHDKAFHQQDIICPYGFWGLRHRIEQPQSLPPDDKAELEAARKVGAGPVLELQAAFTADAKLNQAIINDHIARLSKIEGLRFAPPPAADWPKVQKILNAPQAVYFLCHGEFDATRKESYLGIGPRDNDLDHRVYVSSLNAFMLTKGLNPDEWARLRPLIIINGCHTTDLSPGQLLNFVSSFVSAGAGGVIGTEVSVILPVAAEVGELLLKSLSRNEPVADAIHTIRWSLANRGNLLGLAYTPYCLADLRITPGS